MVVLGKAIIGSLLMLFLLLFTVLSEAGLDIKILRYLIGFMVLLFFDNHLNLI